MALPDPSATAYFRTHPNAVTPETRKVGTLSGKTTLMKFLARDEITRNEYFASYLDLPSLLLLTLFFSPRWIALSKPKDE